MPDYFATSTGFLKVSFWNSPAADNPGSHSSEYEKEKIKVFGSVTKVPVRMTGAVGKSVLCEATAAGSLKE